jgi:ubiquinone/menaquinone biosynthesis C-methylase UbiE
MPIPAPHTYLENLAQGLLRCPACHADGLSLNENALNCESCNEVFPADPALGFATLLPPAMRSNAAKQNIQKWWGDLYEQLYGDTDRQLTPDGLSEMVTSFEGLMTLRRHLAVEEMPLADLAGKQVLEIGPGGGGHSCLFKKYGAQVTVADITPERAVSTVRKLSLMPGPESAGFNADGEHLPFRNDAFDVVYSNGVLHHSENTDQCISEVLRVLKPGGIAVIMLYSRHSATYWLNIAPRALVTGELFRWPEAQWIGRLTEGRPKFGTTKNPFTRVYSRKKMRQAFRHFKIRTLRKSSFQFDNFAFPRLSQIRRRLFALFGKEAHPGGILVYGAPYMAETNLELAIGPVAGFAWNIVAEKPAGDTRNA